MFIKKRSLFIVCSVIMMMCFTIPCLAMDRDENSFTKYNCETGEIEEYEITISNSWEESIAAATPNTNSIIGTNGWIMLNYPEGWGPPYQCIGQIVAKWDGQKTKRGTAVMVSPATALTAGNIIYDKSFGGYADSVTVAISRSNDRTPFGNVTAYELDVPTRYFNYEDDPYDLGLVTLSSPVGSFSGYAKCETLNSDSLQQPDVTIDVFGYPKEGVYTPDPDNWITSGKDMWGAGGHISDITNGVITHDADTVTGMSGAPMLTFNSNYELVVAGIHTVGRGTYNNGIKLKPTFLEWVNENKK